MTLAARHRATPVIFGAIVAFALLNGLAVVFGAAIGSWLPDIVVLSAVAILFALFGAHALKQQDEDEDDDIEEMTSHGLFLTAFLLIAVSEFGDKTQLAVVALSSTYIPFAVWVGATVALAATSILGAIAGITILKKIPIALLHRISGVFFLLLSLFACYRILLVLEL